MIRKGEIYFCQFPYSDKEKFKKRPVLVLTNEDDLGDFLCVKITATFKVGEKYIQISEESLQTGKLDYPSIIACDKITSLNKKLIAEKLAEVKEEFFKEVLQKIIAILKV